MAAGFLAQGVCYSTNVSAADAHFLAQGPFYTAGATSYLGWFEKSAGLVWQIKRQSIASGGAITNLTTSNATVPTFPTCDTTEQFFDGMSLGWGVAAAIVAAWVIKNLRRGL